MGIAVTGEGPRSGTWEGPARTNILVNCSPSGWVTNGYFVLLMFAYTLFCKYSEILQSINKQKTPHTKLMTGVYLQYTSSSRELILYKKPKIS